MGHEGSLGLQSGYGRLTISVARFTWLLPRALLPGALVATQREPMHSWRFQKLGAQNSPCMRDPIMGSHYIGSILGAPDFGKHPFWPELRTACLRLRVLSSKSAALNPDLRADTNPETEKAL